MINFNNVTFSYKGSEKQVLKDFSLNINKGDRIWLSGESGRGKTTVLRLIMGLEKATKGKISVDGNVKISAVFQEDRLIPFVSVGKNISLFSSEEKAKELLSELSLSEWFDSPIDSLSGGMKRRLSIARALSKDFDLLILDEAFNGLDKDTAENVAAVINKYCEGKTIITVTHHKNEAEMLSAKEIKL